MGGPIEAEILLQAAAEGFVVVGVMAVFGAFNAVVSHYELVQSTPRAFYELGLVVTVALAFVPSTIQAIAAVREADRARTGGRVVRRGRLVRQAIPVLESGIERAVSLAESMDARGFAYGGASPLDRVAGWAGLGGAARARRRVRRPGRARAGGRTRSRSRRGRSRSLAAVGAASAARHRTRYRPRRFTGRRHGDGGHRVARAARHRGARRPAVTRSLTWAASPLQLAHVPAAAPARARGACSPPLLWVPHPEPRRCDCAAWSRWAIAPTAERDRVR